MNVIYPPYIFFVTVIGKDKREGKKSSMEKNIPHYPFMIS